MLSRLADSLYWLGRYMERSEHLARYLRVQYFSTMDAPMSDEKDFVLRSILNMSGIPFPSVIDENEVLFKVALDKGNTNSIIYNITQARENTLACRNILSKEMLEAINDLFYFVKNYPVETYKTTGLYQFTTHVQQKIAYFCALLDNTLVHDDVWHFIRLGIHLERIFQIYRILTTKLVDIKALKVKGENIPLENYQWVITLKTLESLDMSRRQFMTTPNRLTACEFLITNLHFPRSIAYNFQAVARYIERLSDLYGSDRDEHEKTGIAYLSKKLAAKYRYLDTAQVLDDVEGFLKQTLEEAKQLNELIGQRFSLV